MFLQRLQFILCIIVSIFVSKCRAPPIQQEYTISASGLAIFSILRAVLLVYMIHVVTVRPRTGITDFPTLHRRIIAFIYPTGGIGTSIYSMYKLFYADKILGISQYSHLLKRYEKEEQEEKEQKAKEGNGIMAENTNSPHTPLLPKISTPEGEKNQVDSTRLTESQTLCLKVSKLRERLVKAMKIERIKIDEWDNSPHLAAFLHVIGPENSRKTRHCILSGSVTIGFDNKTSNMYIGDRCKTKEISVLGPGAICESQGKIHPTSLRYMSIDMINQLETAYNTDNTSYVELFVTIGQIFFTTLECLNLDGDRWIKVVLIIYTATAALQTVSLLVLHKQTTAFSIKDEEDKQLVDTYEKRLLTEEDREIFRKIIIDLDQNVNLTLYGILFGIIVSLAIGVWADYSIHSVTEWLVISWILSPCLIAIFNQAVASLGHWDNLVLTMAVPIISMLSFGCLIAATITGYMPE
ncbi:hypothetical protein F4703DRAFT_1878161 [Phycomyces blakesleeanus]